MAKANVIYLPKPKRRIKQRIYCWPPEIAAKKIFKPVKFAKQQQVIIKSSQWASPKYIMTHKRVRRNGVIYVKYLLTDLCWHIESALQSLPEYEQECADLES